MTRSVTAREARNSIGALVHHVNLKDDEVIVTFHGKPRAVLMSFATYEELRLTLDQKRKQDALVKRDAFRHRMRASRLRR